MHLDRSCLVTSDAQDERWIDDLAPLKRHELHSERESAKLHFVSKSATTTSLSDRMAATSSRLTAVSRRLTAERGLAGFTIEELCAEVGVSRRTFFNYFPSKEDAVVGLDEAEEMQRLADAFLGRESRGWAAVVEDFIEIAAEHTRELGLDLAAHSELVAAISREPRLLARFVDITHDREQQIAELIAFREGVSTDDLGVLAAAQTIGGALRIAGRRILDPRFSGDFASTLLDAAAAMRGVFADCPTAVDPPTAADPPTAEGPQ